MMQKIDLHEARELGGIVDAQAEDDSLVELNSLIGMLHADNAGTVTGGVSVKMRGELAIA